MIFILENLNAYLKLDQLSMCLHSFAKLLPSNITRMTIWKWRASTRLRNEHQHTLNILVALFKNELMNLHSWAKFFILLSSIYPTERVQRLLNMSVHTSSIMLPMWEGLPILICGTGPNSQCTINLSMTEVVKNL